jgi:hypothetical protein
MVNAVEVFDHGSGGPPGSDRGNAPASSPSFQRMGATGMIWRFADDRP